MTAACPECAGPWLYSLTFRHRVDCALYAADSATAAADHERRRGTRPATPTERTYLDALTYEPPADGEHIFVTFDHGGIHWREPLYGPPGADQWDRRHELRHPGRDTPGA